MNNPNFERQTVLVLIAVTGVGLLLLRLPTEVGWALLAALVGDTVSRLLRLGA